MRPEYTKKLIAGEKKRPINDRRAATPLLRISKGGKGDRLFDLVVQAARFGRSNRLSYTIAVHNEKTRRVGMQKQEDVHMQVNGLLKRGYFEASKLNVSEATHRGTLSVFL